MIRGSSALRELHTLHSDQGRLIQELRRELRRPHTGAARITDECNELSRIASNITQRLRTALSNLRGSRIDTTSDVTLPQDFGSDNFAILRRQYRHPGSLRVQHKGDSLIAETQRKRRRSRQVDIMNTIASASDTDDADTLGASATRASKQSSGGPVSIRLGKAGHKHRPSKRQPYPRHVRKLK